jgi:hypothetical protein
VYLNRCFAPGNVVATAADATTVNVSWDPVPGASGYEVYRNSGAGFAVAGNPSGTAFVDSGRTADTSYLYTVAPVFGVNLVGNRSRADLATTTVFEDNPLVAGTAVKANHFEQLRTAANAVRALVGYGPTTFTDVLNSSMTIKAIHLQELRASLDASRIALDLPPLTYTDPEITAGVTKAKTAHVEEPRAGVQ